MEEDKQTKELREFKEQMEKESSSPKSPESPSDSQTSSAPEVIFNTHKFLYTLYHNGEVKGHEIVFTNRSGNEQTIELDSIEIGASPISAKFYDTEGKRHIIPFLRIHKVYRQGQLMWEGEEQSKDVKIIKGF
ncbi:MAG: hypothetical protein VX028_02160 [Nanoarchaeota archaeon]|nr:hypothetical protein [Nanoarchaeota archaeon]